MSKVEKDGRSIILSKSKRSCLFTNVLSIASKSKSPISALVCRLAHLTLSVNAHACYCNMISPLEILAGCNSYDDIISCARCDLCNIRNFLMFYDNYNGFIKFYIKDHNNASSFLKNCRALAERLHCWAIYCRKMNNDKCTKCTFDRMLKVYTNTLM